MKKTPLFLKIAIVILSLASNGCKGVTINVSETPDAVETPNVAETPTSDEGLPELTYSGSPFIFTRTQAITQQVPSNSGEVVTSCTVDPPLPTGLNLSSTCVLSGTPSVLSAATTYVVTATNSGGSTQSSLNITVKDILPSSLAYSSNPATYLRNSAISSNSPTNSGGDVVSYSVSPALPTGLSLSPSTGVITGTPTELVSTAPYTVTATNTGGSTTATVTITVNDAAPNALTYSNMTAIYTKDSAIASNTPSNSGGTVMNYTVSPALPSGLALAPSTGEISGTPTAVTATSNYTVTATNSGGSTTATLSITVKDVVPSSLAFAGSPFLIIQNSLMTASNTTHSGGAITECTSSPSLPAGLTVAVASNECQLSGTPTTAQVAANYTITASNTGGSTTTAVSIAVAGTATKFGFISSPGGQSYVSQTNFSPPLTVAVQDANGVTVSNSTLPITIALVGNTLAGTLSGTLTRSAVSGVATFNDIQLNKAGTTYTMNATGSLTAAPTTAAFTITAGPASQMAYTTAVSSTNVNVCTGPYQLTSQDASANIATNTSGSAWNIELSQNGSASFYGAADSSCSGAVITQTSLGASQSASSNFYLKDAVVENVILTADGASAGLGTKTYPVSVTALTCPTNYVMVPGNSLYNTPTSGKNFCVMKYDASQSGSTAVSSQSGTPWVNINRASAAAACAANGANYHLITNSEWMVIARNIEANSANWNTASATGTGPGPGPVGTGVIPRGNSNSSAKAAASTDSNPYSGTGYTDWTHKRTHILSNSEIIWDMAGNVWNWVSDNLTMAVVSGYQEYSNASYFPFPSTSGNRLLYAPNGAYDSAQGMGKVNMSNAGAIHRGGAYDHGSLAGIFDAGLGSAPSAAYPDLGFRCALTLP